MIKDVYQIEVSSPANSISAQLALFKLGYRWDDGQKGQHAQFVNAKYLTIHYFSPGTGMIRASDDDQGFDTIQYKDGKFRVKHYPQLVVSARDKWRTEFELNQTMDTHKILNDYRVGRGSNSFRINSNVEQLCEYILYLEDRNKMLECLV